MLKNNVETFLACDAPYEDAKIVLFGAPFDSTTSFRPGTRFGSSAIRHESFGLETYSPYQDKDLEEYAVFDSGDLELCFGSSEMALQDIEERTATISRTGNCLSWVGGEHLVTLGAFRAVLKKYPDVQIIHFDAHTDLRDDYLGAKLSHACVIRRCHDLIGDGKIHQFCIRSGEKAEWQFARQHTDLHPSASEDWNSWSGIWKRVRFRCTSPSTWTAGSFGVPGDRYPGSRGRHLHGAAERPAAGGPDKCGGRRRERTGTHVGCQRRLHRRGLQSGPGTAAGAVVRLPGGQPRSRVSSSGSRAEG